MWRYILTLLLSIAKIGTIWATKRLYRKTFQTATVIIVTIIIIRVERKKDEFEKDRKNEKYIRFYE